MVTTSITLSLSTAQTEKIIPERKIAITWPFSSLPRLSHVPHFGPKCSSLPQKPLLLVYTIYHTSEVLNNKAIAAENGVYAPPPQIPSFSLSFLNI